MQKMEIAGLWSWPCQKAVLSVPKNGEDVHGHTLMTAETSSSCSCLLFLLWDSWGTILRYLPHVNPDSFNNGSAGLKGQMERLRCETLSEQLT